MGGNRTKVESGNKAGSNLGAINQEVGKKVDSELEKQFEYGVQFKGRRSGLGFST